MWYKVEIVVAHSPFILGLFNSNICLQPLHLAATNDARPLRNVSPSKDIGESDIALACVHWTACKVIVDTNSSREWRLTKRNPSLAGSLQRRSLIRRGFTAARWIL